MSDVAGGGDGKKDTPKKDTRATDGKGETPTDEQEAEKVPLTQAAEEAGHGGGGDGDGGGGGGEDGGGGDGPGVNGNATKESPVTATGEGDSGEGAAAETAVAAESVALTAAPPAGRDEADGPGQQESRPLITLHEGVIANYNTDSDIDSVDDEDSSLNQSKKGKPSRWSGKRKARFSIRSHGSMQKRFTSTLTISDHPDEGGGEMYLADNDGEVHSLGNTSLVTIQTTKEQSESNSLSFFNDAGSAFGSAVLLTSPSFLEIYANTITEHADGDLQVIAEEEEPADNEGIFSNPEYVNTCEGHLQLAQVARMIAKDRTRYGSLFDKKRIKKSKRGYRRRAVIIGAAFFFIFSSFYAIRSAQSSLGNDRSLSTMAYGAAYSLMWFGGLMGNPAIHRMRPKYVMAICSLAFVAYPLSNLYPTYYTLLPVAVLVGFAVGLIWAVEGIYLMNVASAYALVTDGKLVKVITRFNGIVCVLFTSSIIFGNLMSSIILGDFYRLPGEEEHLYRVHAEMARAANNSNATTYYISSSSSTTTPSIHITDGRVIAESCGLRYTPGDPPVSTTYIYKKYIFFGSCIGSCVIGSLLLFFAVTPLKVAKVADKKTVREVFIKFLGIFKHRRIYLLMPMMSYFGLILTLIMSDFNAAFISCIYGAGMVGFISMTAYIFSVIGTIISGKVVAKTGRVPIIVGSTLMSLMCAVSMLIWKPKNNEFGVLIFVPLWLWGLSDGILFSQFTGFLGVLFKKQATEAVQLQALLLACAAVAGTFLMAYGVMTLLFKVCLAIVLNVVALVGYCITEYQLKKRSPA